jgi:hypothetical protein
MSGRRAKFFPKSKKTGYSSPEFLQNKVYSVVYCIVFPGLVTTPFHIVVCCCSWNEQWKILSFLSQIFLEINLIYRKCDVSFKKNLFRTKFKNIQLNFAQIICIESTHSYMQVSSLSSVLHVQDADNKLGQTLWQHPKQ